MVGYSILYMKAVGVWIRNSINSSSVDVVYSKCFETPEASVQSSAACYSNCYTTTTT